MFSIDLLRIYNRALTAVEIERLFSNPEITTTKAVQTVGTNFLTMRDDVFSTKDNPTLEAEGVTKLDSLIIGDDIIYTDAAAHYPLESSLGKNTKSVNNLTFTNATFVTGVSGNAARFTGTASFATGSDAGLATGSTDRTISLWVRPAAFTNAGLIGYGTATNDNLFSIHLGSTSNNKIYVSKYGTDGDFSTGTLELNVWQHVAVTLSNNTEITYYINGQNAGTATLSGINTTLSAIWIGKSHSAGTCFNGDIDEVRIYNTKLNALDILKLYQSPSSTLIVNGVDLGAMAESSSDADTLDGYHAAQANTALTIPVRKNDNSIIVTSLDIDHGDATSTRFTWNAAEGTIDMTLPNSTTNQLGQETYFYGKAVETIENGMAVMFAGIQGNHITFKKADMNAVGFIPEWVIGVSTQNITNGNFGYVTWFGKVNGVFTRGINNGTGVDWNNGDILYLHPTTAGRMTTTIPTPPKPWIQIAAVIAISTGSSENGILMIRPTFSTGIKGNNDVLLTGLADRDILEYDYAATVWKNVLNPATITLDPTGFDNPSGITVTYSSVNRTVTLTGTFKAYWRGREVAALTNGWVSDPHDVAPTTSLYLYYNGTAFVWAAYPAIWTFDSLMICVVSWVSPSAFHFALRECHSILPWSVHQELHQTIGTYLYSGGVFTPNSYTLSSITPANRRPLLDLTYIKDEDIITANAALVSNSYTWMWLTGTTTSTSNFSTGNTEIVSLSTNRPYYNQWTGSAWAQTLMAGSSFMSVWLFSIPATADTASQNYRYIWVQGQTNSGTYAIENSINVNQLNLGSLTSMATELVAIGRIIIEYTGSDWKLYSVEKLSGTKLSQIASPAGNFLSGVTTDLTLVGNGTASIPLSVSNITPHISTPTNPASGYIRVYAKSDDKLYKLTSAGVETEITGGTGPGGGINATSNTSFPSSPSFADECYRTDLDRWYKWNGTIWSQI